MIGIIIGIIVGACLSAYVTLSLLCKSNEHGNSYGGFRDLANGLNIIELKDNVSKNDYIQIIQVKKYADKQKEKEKEYLAAVTEVGNGNEVN